MGILPLDIRDALKVARENNDLVERVVDTASIASFFPREEKRVLIDELVGVANSISNDEDRARALKAISNEHPKEHIIAESCSSFSNTSPVFSGHFKTISIPDASESISLIPR
jgi:hypothetical protein